MASAEEFGHAPLVNGVQAGLGPEEVQVCELHDCFTANELLTYESLGLTKEGTAEKFICDEQNTYGGRVVTLYGKD